MPTRTRGARHPAAWPLRVVRARPRLFVSIAVWIAATAVLVPTTDWRLATRLLVGWDIGIGLYLALAFHMMGVSDVHHLRRRAGMEDEGRFAILILTVAAALASLGAIFAELGSSGGGRQPVHLLLATATIVLSWALIHMIFALHYAHEFYDEDTRRARGLSFPGGERDPDYWDFVYFSFVIGMTSQVSDVGVTSRHIRRTVAAHGVVSFVFNAALLALTVNIAASAI
ncbi:MAG TPA: DUF1345 domain-containing protein [Methylomirabilota bacterium]|jgi:uncharacterized membrane protein|nr:DUF1345 domain-containing protein [Methylomirabilota bacterium]